MIKKKKISFGFIFLILLLGLTIPLFSSSILVIAQTSTIEVTVVDSLTLNPIEGADVTLYDDMYSYLDDDITDITGFCDFTGLGAGGYYVEVSADGYLWTPDQYVYIVTDGDTGYADFLLTLAYTPGDGFIDVYVYDSVTLTPIVGADVELYTMGNYITSGVTDGTGFYNFTGLGADDYHVFAYATDYEDGFEPVTIDYDGEGESAEFYLDLIFIPGDGFIDVYVYDPSTLTPIVGADVDLYNENWYYITSGVTDGTGFYNFTGLGAATYVVDGSATGFYSNDSSVMIDFDGEGEYLMLYLAPEYTPGTSIINVYVYDNDTLSPIVGADVILYTGYYGYVDWGTTDMSGYYQFTGLGADNYIVEGQMTGYVKNSSLVTIVTDGDTESLDLYLPPFVHTIEILSPSDSATIEGGLVFVSCDINDEYNIDYIEVYVNALLITTFSGGGFIPEFLVPVFGNGTNTIQLDAYWLDMSTASDSVSINSINVIPTVNIKEGDYLYYKQNDLVGLGYWYANFTFTTWLSSFVMLTNYTVLQYDSGGTLLMEAEFWLQINVLNGYVSVDPSHSMEYQHFFPFGCLPPNPAIGDKTVWVPWSNIMTVNGSITWEYTEVWTLEVSSLGIGVYIEKSSNILHYLLMPGMMEMILLNTSIDFINPYVSDAADFAYDEGDTGNTISWTATDMFPATYTIYKDGVPEQTGFWNSVTPITINVDGLAAGTYVYLLVVVDRVGNTAQDSVTITVNPIIPEFETHYLIFIPIIVLTTYLFAWRRKKYNK